MAGVNNKFNVLDPDTPAPSVNTAADLVFEPDDLTPSSTSLKAPKPAEGAALLDLSLHYPEENSSLVTDEEDRMLDNEAELSIAAFSAALRSSPSNDSQS